MEALDFSLHRSETCRKVEHKDTERCARNRSKTSVEGQVRREKIHKDIRSEDLGAVTQVERRKMRRELGRMN